MWALSPHVPAKKHVPGSRRFRRHLFLPTRVLYCVAMTVCASTTACGSAPPSSMNSASLIRLLILSAIFGTSFVFIRLGVPVLGPITLIACRVLLAALFLAVVGSVVRHPLQIRRNGAHFLVLGLFNTALPFLLFAFSARTLSASLLSILNATGPIWAQIFGALWTGKMPTGRSSYAAASRTSCTFA